MTKLAIQIALIFALGLGFAYGQLLHGVTDSLTGGGSGGGGGGCAGVIDASVGCPLPMLGM